MQHNLTLSASHHFLASPFLSACHRFSIPTSPWVSLHLRRAAKVTWLVQPGEDKGRSSAWRRLRGSLMAAYAFLLGDTVARGGADLCGEQR